MKDEQNFLVQVNSRYPIILGEPYITVLWMETKMMDNGLAYARIRNQDGKQVI